MLQFPCLRESGSSSHSSARGTCCRSSSGGETGCTVWSCRGPDLAPSQVKISQTEKYFSLNISDASSSQPNRAISLDKDRKKVISLRTEEVRQEPSVAEISRMFSVKSDLWLPRRGCLSVITGSDDRTQVLLLGYLTGRAMLKCSFDIFLDYFLELLVIINRVNSKTNMQRYCIVFYIYTTYICIQKDVLVVQFPFYNYPIFSK